MQRAGVPLPRSLSRWLIRGFSSQWFRRLRQVGREAEQLGVRAFLVGGGVRDLLLKRHAGNPDVVIEGESRTLAQRLTTRWHARVVAHPRFLTFVFTFSEGTHLDVATARTERYPTPAALPQVSPASIQEDLWRRDFSMNALAVCLNPDRWGEFLDPTRGLQDLRRRRLRVLHEQSFRDDPTRIFRAARFAARYRFSLESHTRQWLRAALVQHLPSMLSPERRREELWALLAERDPLPALRLLQQWGGLSELLPRLPGEPRPERKPRKRRVATVEMVLWFRGFRRCPRLPAAVAQPLRRMVFFSAFSPDRVAICLRGLRLPNAEIALMTLGLELWRGLVQTAKTRGSPLPPMMGRLQGLGAQVRSLLDHWMRIAAGDDRPLRSAWQRLKESLPHVDGTTLKRLGYHPGPQFHMLLSAVAQARWEGRVRTPSEEVRFIIDNYPPP